LDSDFRAVEDALTIFPNFQMFDVGILQENGVSEFGRQPRGTTVVVADADQHDNLFHRRTAGLHFETEKLKPTG
jgi:hypothetical protein